MSHRKNNQELDDIAVGDTLLPSPILWVREGLVSPISEEALKHKIQEYETIALDTETSGDFTNLFDRKIVMLQLGTSTEQFV
jgi:hypothetical protein